MEATMAANEWYGLKTLTNQQKARSVLFGHFYIMIRSWPNTIVNIMVVLIWAGSMQAALMFDGNFSCSLDRRLMLNHPLWLVWLWVALVHWFNESNIFQANTQTERSNGPLIFFSSFLTSFMANVALKATCFFLLNLIK